MTIRQDLSRLLGADPQEAMRWGAEETLSTLRSPHWLPKDYPSLEAYERSDQGQYAFREVGPKAMKGWWMALCDNIREENIGKCQSLIRTAWWLTREQDKRADLVWGYLMKHWGWQVTSDMPETLAECGAAARYLCQLPWKLRQAA